MFERELRIYRFLADYERQILKDLPEEAMRHSAYPGGNPPSWIIGHLAIATDFCLMILGKPARCPKSWMVMFGPGSDPKKHLEKHPGKAELVAALESGHQAVEDAMQRIETAALEKPSPFEPLRAQLPTAGDLLAHLLTSHESSHLSQLSACRRNQGQPPLF